jgi:hypothetical protein
MKTIKMAIAEKPVPIVPGPASAPYAIDHHHAWRRHCRDYTCLVVLIRTLSSLTRAEFWLTMENHRWMCPFYEREGAPARFAGPAY